MRTSRGLAFVAAVALVSGCLANTHKISKGELQRLANTPPERRGDSVRTLQELGSGSQPPPAGHVDSGTNVYVGVVVFDGGRPSSGHAGHGTHDSSGGGGGGKLPGGTAASKSDNAAAWFVLAGLVAITAAFTEGARYDGWVRMHPMHPVHLWGPGGYTVLPLAHIDAATAAWADEAVVRESEGPWQPLGRAPFNRRGFAFNWLMGSATIPSFDSATATGFGGHVSFGYYWTHTTGLLLDWGLAMRDNVLDQRIYDSRWSLELDYLPLDAGPLHGGVFGALGVGTRYEDGYMGGKDDYMLLHGGAMAQLSLTTRLALTARFGLRQDARAEDNKLISEATFGLSIY